MEEQLISFDTAKLAKEKGFRPEKDWNPEYVKGYKVDEYTNIDFPTEFKEEDWHCEDYYLSPSQSLLQKWLREIHNIEIMIEPFGIKSLRKYGSNILNDYFEVDNIYKEEDIFSTYEEALEDALQEALKSI